MYESSLSHTNPFQRLSMKNRIACTLGLLALALAPVGCSHDGGLQEGAVAAVAIVTLDGVPIEGATVTFAPVNGGRSATGRTAETGQVAMGTSAPGDGVFPGEYQVSVIKKEVDPSTVIEDPQAYFDEHQRPPPSPKETYVVPKKYSQAKTSGLAVTITEEGDNNILLELSSK